MDDQPFANPPPPPIAKASPPPPPHMEQADQIEQFKSLLENFKLEISNTTKTTIQTALEANAATPSQPETTNDLATLSNKQNNLISAIQEAHDKQIETLRAAIAEERKQNSQAQMVFEQTLKTRYEHMVDSLQDKVKNEQETRMQRALENIERSARIESERAKELFELQQEAENVLSSKFSGIVADLRKSWEEEESGRSMQIEDRLRSHYNVVLEHMEAQLKMALKLQDDADKQWMEDVEARNKQQLETLKAFEDKCKRLYETRLVEYAEKTSQQIAQYEEELLEAGSTIASERAQFESRLRRLKLACSRWKMYYQKDVHEKYQSMTNVLEERYMIEVSKLLGEISDVKASLAESHKNVEMKEKELLKFHEVSSNSGLVSTNGEGSAADVPPMEQGISAQAMRENLFNQWNELKTPVADRVEALVSLIDSAKVTPQFLARYEYVNNKLSDRVPIAQAISRKQFIEYKLKLASRLGGDGGSLTPAERATLITELTEIQASMDQATKLYEKKYGESYFKFSVPGGVGSGEGKADVAESPVKFKNSSVMSTQHMRVRRL